MYCFSKKISNASILAFRVNFFKTFGFQKLDIVNYTNSEESAFKKIIFSNAIELNKRLA
jgi:uncharacterized protein